MCERELGMLDINRKPKPMLLEMKRFSEFLNSSGIDLPPKKSDAVCILSQGQDHWGIANVTYILSRQAGLDIDFCYCEQELPDSRIYLLPSVTAMTMNKHSYDKLKQKVREGATLYIFLCFYQMNFSFTSL